MQGTGRSHQAAQRIGRRGIELRAKQQQLARAGQGALRAALGEEPDQGAARRIGDVPVVENEGVETVGREQPPGW